MYTLSKKSGPAGRSGQGAGAVPDIASHLYCVLHALQREVWSICHGGQ